MAKHRKCWRCNEGKTKNGEKCALCNGAGFFEPYDDDVVCPYCLEIIDDAWEYFSEPDQEETIEIECIECGKTFKVTIYVSRWCESEKIEK